MLWLFSEEKDQGPDPETLYAKIGKLEPENDFPLNGEYYNKFLLIPSEKGEILTRGICEQLVGALFLLLSGKRLGRRAPSKPGTIFRKRNKFQIVCRR